MSKGYRRFAYMRIGRFVEPLLPRFEDLNKTIRRAGMEVSLRMYLSTALLTTFISIFLGFPAGFGIFYAVNGVINSNVWVGAISVGILVPIVTLLGFLVYPRYVAGNRKRSLESSLPTASSFLAAMASAGVAPDKAFLALANENIRLEISKEAEKITRNIEILGYDMLSALVLAAEESPSKVYSAFLEGLVSVVTSGGDLTSYLTNETKSLMREKIREEKEFIEGLGVIAELFLVIGVVTPIFFVIMLAVLAIMDSSSGQQGTVLMTLLTYVLIPIGMSVIIVLIDGMQPTE
ncbi:MAG: type II secretion system F family protein [Candidatus Heimdallarchaeota archaeon]|nr:type II secretion system F family protein [Candidatus Heimdallarchaeota archaeon]